MMESQIQRARIVSTVAATLIALACGTNYVYSAWAPQFADKLQLTTTQSNLIGAAGNLGMYSFGIPIGMLIDTRGPRPMVILGAVLLCLGYLPFRTSYETATGSVATLSFFSFLTGLGSSAAFNASMKTSALNWPDHRGTATALPLAAFGLSAFFFSLVGTIFFPGNTADFLTLLAGGTSTMIVVGFFFLRVLPHHHHHHLQGASHAGAAYHPVPAADEETKTRPSSVRGLADVEPGMSSSSPSATNITTTASPHSAATSTKTAPDEDMGPAHLPSSAAAVCAAHQPDGAVAAHDSDDETFSLLSVSPHVSLFPGEVLLQQSVDPGSSHCVDIRGWQLLRKALFWQFSAIMALLAGVGLMTINNIGHDVNALWKHWDDSVDDKFLIPRQQLHVSILSLGSFSGRLLSGVGSDFLVKVLKASRVWCLVVASLVFLVAQVCALNIRNPHLLGLVSGFTGLGYGFLYGAFPSMVAESFGVPAMSQNWGFVGLSPVLSSNVFNLFYGAVFDAHTTAIDRAGGGRFCPDGVACYAAAYWFTLVACVLGLLVALWVIRRQAMERRTGEGLDKDAQHRVD